MGKTRTVNPFKMRGSWAVAILLVTLFTAFYVTSLLTVNIAKNVAQDVAESCMLDCEGLGVGDREFCQIQCFTAEAQAAEEIKERFLGFAARTPWQGVALYYVIIALVGFFAGWGITLGIRKRRG